MGVTHIEDTEGNLLWSPTSVEGAYTVQKTQEVAAILAELLSTITIKMEGTIDGETLANVYTKVQCDERFTRNDDFETKVLAMAAAGLILNGNSLTDINDRLRNLWKTCYGTNFDGEIIDHNSYNTLINNLTEIITSLNTYLTRVQHDIYPQNPDGSLDLSRRLFAALSNTGSTQDLSADFGGVARSTLAEAINFVQSETSSTAGSISDVSSDLADLSNNLTTVSSNLNTTVTNIGDVSEIDSELDASNVVGALNKIYVELKGIRSDLNSLTDRVTALES